MRIKDLEAMFPARPNCFLHRLVRSKWSKPAEFRPDVHAPQLRPEEFRVAEIGVPRVGFRVNFEDDDEHDALPTCAIELGAASSARPPRGTPPPRRAARAGKTRDESGPQPG